MKRIKAPKPKHGEALVPAHTHWFMWYEDQTAGHSQMGYQVYSQNRSVSEIEAGDTWLDWSMNTVPLANWEGDLSAGRGSATPRTEERQKSDLDLQTTCEVSEATLAFGYMKVSYPHSDPSFLQNVLILTVITP